MFERLWETEARFIHKSECNLYIMEKNVGAIGRDVFLLCFHELHT